MDKPSQQQRNILYQSSTLILYTRFQYITLQDTDNSELSNDSEYSISNRTAAKTLRVQIPGQYEQQTCTTVAQDRSAHQQLSAPSYVNETNPNISPTFVHADYSHSI